jgi:hypothetical protein
VHRSFRVPVLGFRGPCAPSPVSLSTTLHCAKVSKPHTQFRLSRICSPPKHNHHNRQNDQAHKEGRHNRKVRNALRCFPAKAGQEDGSECCCNTDRGSSMADPTMIDHPARPVHMPVLRKERCQARGRRYVTIGWALYATCGDTNGLWHEDYCVSARAALLLASTLLLLLHTHLFTGIWKCKSCRKTTAGGAYTVS